MTTSCSRSRALVESLGTSSIATFVKSLALSAGHAREQGCGDCTETLGDLIGPREGASPGEPWPPSWPAEPILEEHADDISTRLIELPPERRQMYLRSSRGASSRPVVDALIAASHRHLSTDGERARECAQLAVFVAERLDVERYGQTGCIDLRAVALAELSQAHRRAGDLPGARKTISQAETLLDVGSGHPIVMWTVFRHRAALERDYGVLDTALELLDAAVELCRLAGCRHRLGKTLYDRTIVLGLLGRHQEAIADTYSALLYLDLEREPRLGFVTAHGLALYHEDAGDLSTALHFLDLAERSWHQDMNAGDHVRVAWARGRVHAAAGDLEEAKADFAAARDGFIDLDYPLDAANVTLELAQTLAELGQFAEVRELAAETLIVFFAVGVPKEALAAFSLLETARSVETVTTAIAMVHRLAEATTAPTSSSSAS